MNTNSIAYNRIVTAEKTGIQVTTWFARLINKVSTVFARSELEASQARYALKRQRQAQADGNSVRDLSLTQKHQYGLYHSID